jgi:subtilisin family serine protease
MVSMTGELPWDGLGHGAHCITVAFGDSFVHPQYGLLRGVADPDSRVGGKVLSVKVLSNLGFGSSFGIIKGIEYAYNWGAQIISMSLGGVQQGSVDDDPECQILKQLKDEVMFVVAAGNDGVPDSIGSPGVSPYALTVGSYSPLYKGLASFSSRGPSGEWYRDNPDDWKRDYSKYGENLIKPDCICPGGGPVYEGQKPIDMIVSGGIGWTDGMYDGLVDGFAIMRGTSMATPACAGLVSLLLDKRKITNLDDVKQVLSRQQPKNPEDGYGLIHYSMFGG